jgi:hypothetical protein
MKQFAALSVLALVLVPTLSQAQNGGLGIGLRAGVTLPTDSKTKDAFGGTWFSFGIGPANTGIQPGMSWTPDFGITTRSNGANRLLILKGTYGVTQSLATEGSKAIPYFSARAGMAYVDYRVGSVGARRGVFTGNAEVGIILNDQFRLSARYDFFPELNGYKFDGVTFSITWQIARF